MEEEKALVVAEKLDVAVLFTGDGMDRILKEIETKAMAHVPDVSTDTGRKDIGSLAHKVARSKTLIDDMGKDVVADWKKKAKAIDEHRKTAREFLDDLKARVRQPLTDWEVIESEKKAEADRKEKEKIDKRIAEFAEFNVHLPFFDVAAMTDGYFDSRLIIARADFEAEQKRLADEEAARKAESERLTVMNAEMERKIEELAKKEAEAKAESDRIAAEKASWEAEKKAEQERKDRKIFEAQAKENARIAAEKAEKDRQEREAREAKDKAEKEAAEKARQEALKPDKEKLAVFADKLMKAKNDLMPELVYGSPAYPILDECEHQIEKAIKTLTKKAKEL